MYTTIILTIAAFAAVLLGWCFAVYQESQKLKKKIKEQETRWHFSSDQRSRRLKKYYYAALAGVVIFYAMWLLILTR